MPKFIRMTVATGAVDANSIREGRPVLPGNGTDVKGWRWLEVVNNSGLQAWQHEGAFPPTVSTNATTISRTVIDATLADWKQARLAKVRAEARRRIGLVAPDHRQLNMIARATELTEKKASGSTLTQGEADEVAAFKALWVSINAIRSASNITEAAIVAAATNDDVEIAYNAVAWP